MSKLVIHQVSGRELEFMKHRTESITLGNCSCENTEQWIEFRTQTYFDIVLQFSCYRNRFSTQFGTTENASQSLTNDLSSHWTNILENFCHRRQKSFVKGAKEYPCRVYLLNIYGTTHRQFSRYLENLLIFKKYILINTLQQGLHRKHELCIND